MFTPAASLKGAALVTGAARGLGRAIALRLAADGFDVALHDLPVAEASLEDVKREISKLKRRSAVIMGDVSSEQDVKGMVTSATKHFGRLDVMVANAGVLLPTPLAPLIDTSVEDLDATLAVNVRGVFLCYRYAALQMIAQGRGGRIIGASSIAGRAGWEDACAYSASKFAVRGLTQVAAQEFGKHRITVNAYAPGLINTPMSRDPSSNRHLDSLVFSFFPVANVLNPEKSKAALVTSVANPGTPEDVAGVVSFLASKDAQFITGQTITVDGGRVFS
ncbi:hypothetical protein C8R43DRAFT_1231803 [Mycena crocata]|nr:hypothetical protein C8R43DRAFT_1231803 [Mycena crocata]